MDSSDSKYVYPLDWKPAKGFEGRYALSTHGDVRNVRTGHIIHPVRQSRGNVVINMWQNGSMRQYSLGKLMYETFIGEIPDGYRVIKKSGIKMECGLENLELVTQAEFARYAGKTARKPVLKLDKDGKVVAVYPSASAAAKANCYSIASICNRCRTDLLMKPAVDGCDYAYEDDTASIRRALNRLGVDWKSWTY